MENNSICDLLINFLTQVKNNPEKYIIIPAGYQYNVYHTMATIVSSLSYYDNRVNIYNYCIGEQTQLLYDYF